MLYKRVEIVDMEGGRNLPKFAFTLDEEATARLAAADALAEKADKLLEHIEMGWSHGEECVALDVALREYREVTE